MNGSQEVSQPYSGPQAPPQPPPAAPPAWYRQNVSEVSVPPVLASDPRRKSPALACLLSAMPGLGQVYVGYYQQGFANVLVIATLIVLLGSNGLRALQPMFAFFLAFFWLYNMIDAFRRAAFYNQALAGIGSVPLPPDISLPKGQGSLIGGIALIVVGALVLANTAFAVSLDWLDDWWPAGLVLMGGYLVWASFKARRDATGKTER